MRKYAQSIRSGLVRLFRFLFWYAVAVGTLLYLLPLGARALEDAYDALSSSVKFFAILGVFAVVAVWHVVAQRERWSGFARGKAR